MPQAWSDAHCVWADNGRFLNEHEFHAASGGRLEHLFWIEVIPEDCQFLEFFDSMDGFFMSNDLKFWNRPPGFIFGDENYFIGSIEDWAVELVQAQRGYYDD